MLTSPPLASSSDASLMLLDRTEIITLKPRHRLVIRHRESRHRTQRVSSSDTESLVIGHRESRHQRQSVLSSYTESPLSNSHRHIAYVYSHRNRRHHTVIKSSSSRSHRNLFYLHHCCYEHLNLHRITTTISLSYKTYTIAYLFLSSPSQSSFLCKI